MFNVNVNVRMVFALPRDWLIGSFRECAQVYGRAKIHATSPLRFSSTQTDYFFSVSVFISLWSLEFRVQTAADEAVSKVTFRLFVYTAAWQRRPELP